MPTGRWRTGRGCRARSEPRRGRSRIGPARAHAPHVLKVTSAAPPSRYDAGDDAGAGQAEEDVGARERLARAPGDRGVRVRPVIGPDSRLLARFDQTQFLVTSIDPKAP